MKTAISIPDPIYKDAERLAQSLKMSRSQLYSDALLEYLTRHDSDEATEAMNRVCEAVDSRPDPLVKSAARGVLERSEW